MVNLFPLSSFPFPGTWFIMSSVTNSVIKASGTVLWYLEFYLLDIGELPIETDFKWLLLPRGGKILQTERTFVIADLKSIGRNYCLQILFHTLKSIEHKT